MKIGLKTVMCAMSVAIVALIIFPLSQDWTKENLFSNCTNGLPNDVVERPKDENLKSALEPQDLPPDTFLYNGWMVHAPDCSEHEVQNIMGATLKRNPKPLFYTGAPIEIEHKSSVNAPTGPHGEFERWPDVFEVTFPIEPHDEPGWFGPSFCFKMVVTTSFDVIDYYCDAG